MSAQRSGAAHIKLRDVVDAAIYLYNIKLLKVQLMSAISRLVAAAL